MPDQKILVVVPVYNESGSLSEVIRELRRHPQLDILVVDDASSDHSIQIAREYNARVLPLTIKLGAWGAMQTGLRYAYKHGYQQVITMDGDGQHHGQEIFSLLTIMKSSPDADVVIGACIRRGSRLRQLAWRYFRSINGIGIEDITSGFRLYNANAIAQLIKREATLLEYQDVGVLLMLKANGLKVVETEVCMTPRQNGKSRVYSSWLLVTYYMVVTTILSLSKFKRVA